MALQIVLFQQNCFLVILLIKKKKQLKLLLVACVIHLYALFIYLFIYNVLFIFTMIYKGKGKKNILKRKSFKASRLSRRSCKVFDYALWTHITA